jgi:hypothetical protein
MVLFAQPTDVIGLAIVFMVALRIGLAAELAAAALEDASLSGTREDTPALVSEWVLGNGSESVIVEVGAASALPLG